MDVPAEVEWRKPVQGVHCADAGAVVGSRLAGVSARVYLREIALRRMVGEWMPQE